MSDNADSQSCYLAAAWDNSGSLGVGSVVMLGDTVDAALAVYFQ
jgi:hypothetical protein